MELVLLLAIIKGLVKRGNPASMQLTHVLNVPLELKLFEVIKKKLPGAVVEARRLSHNGIVPFPEAGAEACRPSYGACRLLLFGFVIQYLAWPRYNWHPREISLRRDTKYCLL